MKLVKSKNGLRIKVRIMLSFNSASEAFDYWYWKLYRDGVDFADTKALFNVGFYITNPKNNYIANADRKWSQEYAEAEWQWYLSGDRNIAKLGELYGKVPAIWKRMADDDGNVNSNYGWQWKRNGQLDKVITMLRDNKNTRQAAISIYDAKEINSYATDTPCTYAVQFTVVDDKLNMSVMMRSNDIWYGFCNDQYCFSNLQMLVAYETGYELGTYYHFAHNMHLYNDKLPEQTIRRFHV
ncbi:thymidylate synthase [bacterium]|nr:thymidylate synthase [bacterium]